MRFDAGAARATKLRGAKNKKRGSELQRTRPRISALLPAKYSSTGSIDSQYPFWAPVAKQAATWPKLFDPERSDEAHNATCQISVLYPANRTNIRLQLTIDFRF